MTSRTTFDLLTEPPNNHRPTVATDFEGTLSQAQLYKAILDYLKQEGRGTLARNFLLKRIHYVPMVKLELPIAQSLKIKTMHDLLAIWRNESRETFQQMINWTVDTALFPNLRQSLMSELNAHVADGKRVIIVSGMPEPFMQRLLEKLDGFEGIGTPLRFDGDIFTGEHIGEYNVQAHKVANLQPFLQDGKLAAAYGDTDSDIAMLSLAHDPVAVAPDKKLLKVAQTNSWRVIPS